MADLGRRPASPIPTTGAAPSTHPHADKDRVITFYIENLPGTAGHRLVRDLIRRRWKLLNFKKLEDVFIPGWRNKAGRRFGFVRMSGVENEGDMEASLGKQAIGASKIMCSISKFGRKPLPPKGRSIPTERWTPVKKTEIPNILDDLMDLSSPIFWPTITPQGHEGTGPTSVSIPPSSPNIKTIPLSIPAENKTWLKMCLIGVLRKVEYIPEIQERVNELGWKCVTRILGSSMVCLEFAEVEEKQKALSDNSQASLKTFYKILPWEGLGTDVGRCVWIQCQGIPMQAWGITTFQEVGNAVGRFLAVDDCTSSRKRMDIARLLVSTDNPFIDSKILGNLNGMDFSIVCREEPMQGIVSSLDWAVGSGLYELDVEEEDEENEEEASEESVAGNSAMQEKLPSPDIPFFNILEDRVPPQQDVNLSKTVIPRLRANRAAMRAAALSSVETPTHLIVPHGTGERMVNETWVMGSQMGLERLANEKSMRAFDEARREAEVAAS